MRKMNYSKMIRTRPFLVVVCNDSSAIYDRDYRLRASIAPKELTDYAKQHATYKRNFFDLTLEEQYPTWMTAEKEPKCEMYWLFNDASTRDFIEKIPCEISPFLNH